MSIEGKLQVFEKPLTEFLECDNIANRLLKSLYRDLQ